MTNTDKAMRRAKAQVALTILEQLGGGQFAAMVGLKQVIAHPTGVQFGIGHGAKDGINKVLVMLQADDTYTVEFWTVRKFGALRHEVIEQVYCDSLREIFESRTGFYCTL
jgi:hypothetical protein